MNITHGNDSQNGHHVDSITHYVHELGLVCSMISQDMALPLVHSQLSHAVVFTVTTAQQCGLKNNQSKADYV